MLNELKRFNPETADLEELVSLLHFTKGLQIEFTSLGLAVPEWIDDKARQLTRQVRQKTEDQRALRLKEIAAEEARLETNAEKRARLQAEKDRLTAGVV